MESKFIQSSKRKEFSSCLGCGLGVLAIAIMVGVGAPQVITARNGLLSQQVQATAIAQANPEVARVEFARLPPGLAEAAFRVEAVVRRGEGNVIVLGSSILVEVDGNRTGFLLTAAHLIRVITSGELIEMKLTQPHKGGGQIALKPGEVMIAVDDDGLDIGMFSVSTPPNFSASGLPISETGEPPAEGKCYAIAYAVVTSKKGGAGFRVGRFPVGGSMFPVWNSGSGRLTINPMMAVNFPASGGDSGAGVVCGDGRVLGVLTGGVAGGATIEPINPALYSRLKAALGGVNR